MAIESGEAASADEVMNAMGQLLANQMLLIWDADINKIADGITPGLTNTTYDEFASDTQTETAMTYEATSDTYFGPTGMADAALTTIDEFSDSTVDTDIWETRNVDASGSNATHSVDEDSSGYQKIEVTDVRDGSYAADASTFSRTKLDLTANYNQVVRLRVFKTEGYSTNNDVGTGTARIYLANSDSTTTTTMLTISDNLSTGVAYTDLDTTGWDVDVINAGDYTYWSIDGGTTWTRTDTSGYDEVKIDCEAHVESPGTGGASTLHLKLWLDWYRKNDTDVAFNITQTTATTGGATVTNAIPVMLYDIDLVAPTISLSADNGANFEITTNKQIHRFTDTGTQIKTKLAWNQKTPGVAVKTGVMWNLY